MARHGGTSENDIIRGCCFFALAISALAFLFNGVVELCEFQIAWKALKIINTVGNGCLLVGIAFPAYDFICGKPVGWSIAYWISLVVYVVAFVLYVL